MSDVVKYFHSGMAGAPQMSNGMGQMISVLDNCLINGFNSLTPSGITRTGDVATATFGTAHGYEVDQVILVAGCDQTAYNGEKRIIAVPTSTTLTFAVAGTPATPVTSGTTLNTKAAPLGFTKIFSGTNKAMYQSQNVTTNQWVLRLDGTAWTGYTSGKGVEYKVDICRTASDIDTMTENTTASSATFGQFRWHQTALAGAVNSTAPTANINWALYGNDKQFFFTVGWHSTNPNNHVIYGFGEINSFKSGDAYSPFLMASNFGTAGGLTADAGPSVRSFGCTYNKVIPAQTAIQSDVIIAKAYTGLGGWAQAGLSTMAFSSAATQMISGASSGMNAVNPQDFSLFFFNSYVAESGGFRGRIEGLYSILNQIGDMASGTTFQGIKFTQNSGGVNKTFRVCQSATLTAAGIAYVGFDIIGPWS